MTRVIVKDVNILGGVHASGLRPTKWPPCAGFVSARTHSSG